MHILCSRNVREKEVFSMKIAACSDLNSRIGIQFRSEKMLVRAWGSRMHVQQIRFWIEKEAFQVLRCWNVRVVNTLSSKKDVWQDFGLRNSRVEDAT